jgi:hypothetical protein
MKGFSPQWCEWIKKIVTGGSVGVKINDDIGNFFPTKKGLRQSYPLSPVLFNIVADMLTVLVSRERESNPVLVSRERESNQIEGVVPHLVDGGLSILQYAHDTILFLEDDIEQAKNLKLVLCAFENLPRLKINFSQK